MIEEVSLPVPFFYLQASLFQLFKIQQASLFPNYKSVMPSLMLHYRPQYDKLRLWDLQNFKIWNYCTCTYLYIKVLTTDIDPVKAWRNKLTST